MNQRAGDPAVVRIDRTIPLWGIILLVGSICGQAILLWQGQRDQAAELKATGLKLEALASVVKAMDDQSRLKDTKDVVRDERIADHERRITRIETKLEATR